MNIGELHIADIENALNSGALLKGDDKIEQQNKPSPTPATPNITIGAPVNDGVAPVQLEPQRDEGFAFADPVELLMFLDDDLAKGKSGGGYDLHPWQVQFMVDFAKEGHTKDTPFNASVQAANGSGKDKYIVAACAVWLCMRYIQARAVVTNGSGDQLDNQTEVYIDQLARKVNEKLQSVIWKCNYRYYECLATGSPVKLFATDEPTKAEGYHPIKPGAKMAIFASEAKAIPDEIFGALTRCTGYTHKVYVSSPGNVLGHFYDTCMGALPRKELKDIKELNSTQWLLYKVTARDCPHITESEIEAFAASLPGGKNSPIYRSGVDAEFGATEEMVVIPYTYIYKAYSKNDDIKWVEEAHNKAGLDLSDGGDETVLVVRNGNKLLNVIPFRFDNTEDTIAFLNEQFKEQGLQSPEALIFADCGGLGKPMLDRMRRQGWSNIRYFDNRSTAYEPRTYRNRGAESWFHIRRLLERRELILFYDKILMKQLSSRYYKITNNIHQLLSKLESKKRGFPSPDRADALVLAFSDYKSSLVLPPVTEETAPFKQPPLPKVENDFDLREWAKRDSGNGWDRHPSRGKDFSLLLEDIAESNRLKRERNNILTS